MKNSNEEKQTKLFEESLAIVRYQVAETRDENEILKSDLVKAEELILQLRSEISVKDEEIGCLRRGASRYISRLESGGFNAGNDNTETVARLEATIGELLNSTSWRVTKPLRWLKLRLRRG